MLKKSKRATKPKHQDSSKMDRHIDIGRESTTGNSTLAIGGVSSPLDSFVLAESSVLRKNYCAEKPAHRQSAKRYASA
jgi:hypothetical protein